MKTPPDPQPVQIEDARLIRAIAAGDAMPRDPDDARNSLARLCRLAAGGQLGHGCYTSWSVGSWLGGNLDVFVEACERVGGRTRCDVLRELGVVEWRSVATSELVRRCSALALDPPSLPDDAPEALRAAVREEHAEVRKRAHRPPLLIDLARPLEERWRAYLADQAHIAALAKYFGARFPAADGHLLVTALDELEVVRREEILQVMGESRRPAWRWFASTYLARGREGG